VEPSTGGPRAAGRRLLRTNLTLRQRALLFGVSKSAAGRIIDHLGPALALQQRKRFRKNTVLVADGTLVPTRDHTVAEQSKNYRYSTNQQVVIDADTSRLQGMGTLQREGDRRPHHRHRGRWLRNWRPGKRSTMPPTARSALASSTPSPA
jgi:hypothetical protein